MQQNGNKISMGKIQQQLIIQTMAECQDIVSFLTKYTITYVDPHTTIITQLLPPNTTPISSSFDFLQADHQKNHQMNNSKMPACYLIKDMIVEEGSDQDQSSQNVLKGVMQTLAMHQQLSNKYILTLVHHQVFIKTVVSSQSGSKSNQASQKKQISSNMHRKKRSQCSFSQYEPEYSYQDNDHQISQNQNNLTYNSKLKQNNSLTKLHPDETIISENRTAIRAIYQYGKLTLKEEIGNRVASNTQFEEQELWAILATIVQALGYLEEQGIVYGVLGADKIFINDSLVKVLDPSATATDPLLITEGRLYSPQILNDDQNINMFKSDIYITALVILQCGLLIDLSKQIEPNLGKYLQNFKQSYSKQLGQLLQICLQTNPNQRPSFQELKKHLAKQLDMNDFESAYDTQGMKLLSPLTGDVEDPYNPLVREIQYELQECPCDILYQSVGEDQLQQENRRKNISEYERAKMRYLGTHLNSVQSPRNSLKSNDRNNDSNQRIYSQQHRQRNSSPSTETRRSKQVIVRSDKYPQLNMAISESVYTDEIMPVTTKHADKTNRKFPRTDQNQDYYPNGNVNPILEYKENMNCYQQRTVPNTNQKIKKTKLIKQKLVRKCDEQNFQQTFGAVKKHTNLKSIKASIPLRVANEDRNHGCVDKNNKYDNCGGSIQEEVDQQSESSYLYYNTTGSSKVSKKQQPSGGDSQVSRKSDNISSLRNSGMSKSGSRYQNAEPNQLKNTKSRADLMGRQEQIFTDPELMKNIREHLYVTNLQPSRFNLPNSKDRWRND